jgi:hypothetical protein
MKTIRPKSGDMRSLKLSPEEGFVLSRVDGPTSVKDLVALTGLEESRVVEIVGRLATEGALDVEGAAPAPPASEPEPESKTREREDEKEDENAPIEVPSEASSPELEESATEEEKEKDASDERNYRKVYETVFHPMTREQRVSAAGDEEGANLCALCFDADPQVIHAVLGNPRVGFEHARLIAMHHKTHTGIEMLGRRAEFLADAGVQRKLLANLQTPDNIIRRMINPKLIMDVYKITINREYPERTRVKTRELLQKKFMLGSADERAALMIKTEGRCLIQLIQVALDARTTQILTAKTTYTILFIQNLARWSATPPALLTHLLKQPVVRQNMGLRKMLLKHPNVPSEVKRNLSH